jgi:glycosyltransferase involved in cell wall biosynthesis
MLISIIIPTYNRAYLLKKALESIFIQSYSNFEIIVIDDHSNDNTNEIINSFNDSRLKYLKNKSNGIVATSRNIGIKASKGEWIAFLDSDDWWTSNKLQSCVDNINNKVDFIYHDLVTIDKQSKRLKSRINKSKNLKKPILLDLLINGNPISNSSVMVRKNILEKVGLINESKKLVASEDFNTWLKISKVTDQFLYLPKRLGFYLIHEENISNKDMSLSYRAATDEFLSTLNNIQKIKLESRIRYLSGRFNYLNNDYLKAMKDLLYVIKNNKNFLMFKAMIMILLIFLKRFR